MALLPYSIVLLLGVNLLTKSVTQAVTYTSVVQTDSGPIRGQILETVRQKVKYAAYTAIPYAEAPIGSLRFKPPVKKQKWTNTLDAINQGSACIQPKIFSSGIIGSEDCLFINVFTPVIDSNNGKPSNPKAVMVWIYGGAFSMGSANSYGPDFLIEDDVILVTFNYRVGPLGFLNLRHQNAAGNAGLKDQNLALQWVNKNIEEFGGDPNKVTIFGQSAGAVSVDLHVLSEMSAGLFSKSIAMSGSTLCLYWGIQSHLEAEHNAFTLGSKLGINTLSKDTLLDGLYRASAVDIASNAHTINKLSFRPTIESKLLIGNQKKFLSQCSVDKYLHGNYNKGPHMMGFTSAEAMSIAEIDIINLVKNGLSSLGNASISFLNPVLDQLISVGNFNGLPEGVVKQLIQLVSDLFFVLGIDSKQQLLRFRNKHPIYYYRFSYNSEKYPGWRKNKNNYSIDGVGHAEDIPFLFYLSDVGLSEDPEIQRTISRYVRLMTNFAKHGNPTPNETEDPLLGISWPDSGVLGSHLDINADLTTGLRPVSNEVLAYEVTGLGRSHILNSCFEL